MSLSRLLASSVLAGVLTLAGAVQAQESRPEGPQDMLLGLIVDGEELLVVDGYWDGREFLIPAEAFFEVCRCRREPGPAGSVTISTTLGAADMPESAFVERDGVQMIREHALDARLAVRIVYDPARFALVLDLPWRETPPGEGAERSARTPDVKAPAATLSSGIFRLQHVREPSFSSSIASVTLGGRAAGGTWRGRFDDQTGGAPGRLAEYGWMRRMDDKLLLLGHQRVQLHPLLGGLEMTRAQAAWTNQPLDLFVTSSEPSELLPRQLRSTTTIRGVGIPAGTAILRVGEVAVAAQVMSLDGRYEFQDVALPRTGRQRVEVLIYGRHDPTVPIDIDDHSRTAGSDLLPGGAIVMQGGFGREGNLVDPVARSDGAAGFYQTRLGLGEGLTVEGSYQRSAGSNGFALGATGRLGSAIVASVGAGMQNGSRALMADLEGDFGPWRLSARSQLREEGYDALGGGRQEDHFLELSRRSAGGTLEFGMIAQQRRGYGEDTRFALPWAYWRPDSRILLRARPDSAGRYRFDASWAPDRAWRVGVSRAGPYTVADVSFRATPALAASLVAERLDGGGHREAALLTWTGRGALMPSVAGGPLLANGKPGLLVSAQISPLPGILLGARYETSAALDRPDAARDHRLSLMITGNLAFAGSRVLPGSASGLDARTGGLGGRLKVAEGYRLPDGALEGVVIEIDGRPVTRTARGGRYRVAQLPPGTYRVGFDPGDLPVELTPVDQGLLVEVVPGAVTRADLRLEVEFGVAGRVRAGDEHLVGLAVELVAADGTVVARGRTDRFGLYRLDAVRRGTYEIRLGAPTGGASGQPLRTVHVVDDFLFDQDLILERPPERYRPAELAVAAIQTSEQAPVRQIGGGVAPLGSPMRGAPMSNMTSRLEHREAATTVPDAPRPELVAPSAPAPAHEPPLLPEEVSGPADTADVPPPLRHDESVTVTAEAFEPELVVVRVEPTRVARLTAPDPYAPLQLRLPRPPDAVVVAVAPGPELVRPAPLRPVANLAAPPAADGFRLEPVVRVMRKVVLRR